MNDTTPSLKIAPRTPQEAGNRIPDIGCGRCDNRWGGTSTCHCSGCHETFTGLTAFDQHRTGSHTHGTRRCLPPAEAGLQDAGRHYPCWGNPGDGTKWWGTRQYGAADV